MVLLVGYALCHYIPVLGRYNVPPPVVGGLLVAVTVLITRNQGVTLFKFDTTLQTPLMIAFFTTIGFGASLSLLRVGGPQVLLLLPDRDGLCDSAEPDRRCRRARLRTAIRCSAYSRVPSR